MVVQVLTSESGGFGSKRRRKKTICFNELPSTPITYSTPISPSRRCKISSVRPEEGRYHEMSPPGDSSSQQVYSQGLQAYKAASYETAVALFTQVSLLLVRLHNRGLADFEFVVTRRFNSSRRTQSITTRERARMTNSTNYKTLFSTRET